MIAVNELIQEAYEALNMVGSGEAADDTYSVTGCRELNRLIADLNSQGFLAMTQHWVDASPNSQFVFKKLEEGEEAPSNVINMLPPEKIEGVARSVGNRFVPLMSCDIMQMAQRNPMQIPTSWYYGREFERIGDELGHEMREVGIVRLDGYSRTPVRIWYNSQIQKYTLYDTIYLSDIYNNLLFSGLKYRLACFHELSDSKKAECYAEHTSAQRLIKRNNITQRMLQCGPIAGSYQDSYNNGMAGYGF